MALLPLTATEIDLWGLGLMALGVVGLITYVYIWEDEDIARRRK